MAENLCEPFCWSCYIPFLFVLFRSVMFHFIFVLLLSLDGPHRKWFQIAANFLQTRLRSIFAGKILHISVHEYNIINKWIYMSKVAFPCSQWFWSWNWAPSHLQNMWNLAHFAIQNSIHFSRSNFEIPLLKTKCQPWIKEKIWCCDWKNNCFWGDFVKEDDINSQKPVNIGVFYLFHKLIFSTFSQIATIFINWQVIIPLLSMSMKITGSIYMTEFRCHYYLLRS